MKYPEYDQNKYTVIALPNIMLVFWILNPGAAFNEMILGQRCPKVILIDHTSDRPRPLRTYIPCPHCGNLHPFLLWGKGNAFGHWFGFVCPTCNNIIPCLWNWTSLLILTVSFPIWIIPVYLLKPRWLAYEKIRLNNNLAQLPAQAADVKNINWIFRGVLGGGLMWFIMCVIPFLFSYWQGGISSLEFIQIFSLPIWLVGGLVCGLVMKSHIAK
jgi:hypothetical protein